MKRVSPTDLPLGSVAEGVTDLLLASACLAPGVHPAHVRQIEADKRDKFEKPEGFKHSHAVDHEAKIQRMMKEYGGDKPHVQTFG